MYHIFSINSLVEGYLACFQLLALINKSEMYVVEMCSCDRVEIPLGIFPEVVYLGI